MTQPMRSATNIPFMVFTIVKDTRLNGFLNSTTTKPATSRSTLACAVARAKSKQRRSGYYRYPEYGRVRCDEPQAQN